MVKCCHVSKQIYDTPCTDVYTNLKFQVRPAILCMTATITEVTESSTIRNLGISSDRLFKIQRNPTNPNISFINSTGTLNSRMIADLLQNKGKQCPRILIFEKSLVDCGLCFLEIKKVGI